MNKLTFVSTRENWFLFPLRALRFPVKLLWFWIYVPFAEEDLSP